MAELPVISVVVPTFNRKEVLEKCLDAVLSQSISGYEVIVVDDGSSDGTGEMVRARYGGTDRVRYMRQENSGPAAARNLGIESAQAGIVCFIDDDIVADERLLEEHLKAHLEDQEPCAAVLGFVAWSPDVRVTPFMHWLDHGGWNFHYDDLEGKRYAGYKYCYTCNISYKKKFLLENGGFDSQFRMAVWEDMDLSYRLSKNGLRTHYRKAALAWHRREVTVRQFMHRCFNLGRYSLVFHAKHPEAVNIKKYVALLNPLLPLDDGVVERLVDGFDPAGQTVDVARTAEKNAWFYKYALGSANTKGILHELYFQELLTPEQAEKCRATLGLGAFNADAMARGREFTSFIEGAMKERAHRRWKTGRLTDTLAERLKMAERFLRRHVLKPYILKPFDLRKVLMEACTLPQRKGAKRV